MTGWAVALAVLTTAWSSHAAPAEAYGKLPEIEQPRISPDGRRLAYLGRVNGEAVIVIVGLAKDASGLVIRLGDARMRSLEWVDDGHLLGTRSLVTKLPWDYEGPTHEFSQGFVFDIATQKSVPLQAPARESALDVLLAPPEIRTVAGKATVYFEGPAIATVTIYGRGRLVEVRPRLLALASGDSEVKGLRFADQYVRDYVIDAAGADRGHSFFRSYAWWADVRMDRLWRDSSRLSAEFIEPQLDALSPDGDGVLVKTGMGADWLNLSFKDGSLGASGLKGDAVVKDPRTGLAIGMRGGFDHTSYGFMDPRLQAAWAAISRLFPGEQVDFESSSDDRTKIAVHVFGTKSGSAYFMIDMNSGAASPIGARYRGIGPADIADVRTTVYKASDGATLTAYLTLPATGSAKNLPLIVLPHDGPAGRDYLQFNWLAQALASRGYAVLQPQFRGSSGQGEAFLNGGFGHWGGKMQTDLDDGVKALIAQGVADPKRVCAIGHGGYAGYAALMAAAQGGLYRCAVSIGGISDLQSMIQWERLPHSTGMPYFRRYMDFQLKEAVPLAQSSPAKLATTSSAATLLIHTQTDEVVPMAQSEEMAAALKAAGRTAQLVQIPGDDHGLADPATRTAALKALIDFLAVQNPA